MSEPPLEEFFRAKAADAQITLPSGFFGLLHAARWQTASEFFALPEFFLSSMTSCCQNPEQQDLLLAFLVDLHGNGESGGAASGHPTVTRSLSLPG